MISPATVSQQSQDLFGHPFRINPRDTWVHAILRRVDTLSEAALAVHGCVDDMGIRGRDLRRVRYYFVHIGRAGEAERGCAESNR